MHQIDVHEACVGQAKVDLLPKDASVEAHRVVKVTPCRFHAVLDDDGEDTEERYYSDIKDAKDVGLDELLVIESLGVQILPLDTGDQKSGHGQEGSQRRIVDPEPVVQIILLDELITYNLVRVLPHELAQRRLIPHVHVHRTDHRCHTIHRLVIDMIVPVPGDDLRLPALYGPFSHLRIILTLRFLAQ